MNYLEELKKSILDSTENIDNIVASLDKMKGNTICVGSGGSHVVGEYASSIISKVKSCISYSLDPRDLHYANLDSFDNIFIASYSGSNFGVKSSIIKDKNTYLLSSRKTNISNEVLLHYDMEREDSFISIKSTIIPMSILLKYYLKDKFYDILDDIFDNINLELFLNVDGSYVNIYHGIDCKASSTFLESTFTESRISVPLMHEKYSYCHGRSTINKGHDSSAIYLSNRNTDLDRTIISVLEFQMKDYLVIDSRYDDIIIDDFYQTIQCLLLMENIARKKKINLRKIKYDKEAVKKLYFFKGSM